MYPGYQEKLLSLRTGAEFEKLAIEVFAFQYANLALYREYSIRRGIHPSKVLSLRDIPFMPIEFFRDHAIISNEEDVALVFTSSGSTGGLISKHPVYDPDLYLFSLFHGFRLFYGDPANYCILALLPSYLERQNSSLVYMFKKLMLLGGHADNGFYLDNYQELVEKIDKLEKEGQKTLLIGVSFALLDLAEKYRRELKHTLIMETGGMKGRRKEITREELHAILKSAFGLEHIHSEYGMTELLSQAYSCGLGLYFSPPWMKILIRDIYDPLGYAEYMQTGGINVIDLANLWSCSFIETRDLGREHPGGGFEVLGRFDNSDARGCNLMVE
jgi:hypothetical protein